MGSVVLLKRIENLTRSLARTRHEKAEEVKKLDDQLEVQASTIVALTEKVEHLKATVDYITRRLEEHVAEDKTRVAEDNERDQETKDRFSGMSINWPLVGYQPPSKAKRPRIQNI